MALKFLNLVLKKYGKYVLKMRGNSGWSLKRLWQLWYRSTSINVVCSVKVALVCSGCNPTFFWLIRGRLLFSLK